MMMNEERERIVGELKTWKGDRGFGFLSRDAGSDVFLHIRSLESAGITGEPEIGDRFEFELIDGRHGRKEAGELRRVYD
jgi:CspA family cold shock protein